MATYKKRGYKQPKEKVKEVAEELLDCYYVWQMVYKKTNVVVIETHNEEGIFRLRPRHNADPEGEQFRHSTGA